MGSPVYSGSGTVRPGRKAIMLLMTVYGTACQSWHTERLAPDAVLATRQPAQVRVTRTDGSRIVIEQPALVGDTLVGSGRGHHRREEERVALADVREVATRRFDAGETIGLAAVVGAGLYGAFLALFLASCGSGCR